MQTLRTCCDKLEPNLDNKARRSRDRPSKRNSRQDHACKEANLSKKDVESAISNLCLNALSQTCWNSWNSNLTAQQLLHIAAKSKAEAQCPAIQFTLLTYRLERKVLHWLESKRTTLHVMFYRSRCVQIWIPKLLELRNHWLKWTFWHLFCTSYFAASCKLTYLNKHSSKRQESEKRDRIRRSVNQSVSIALTGGFQPIWKICVSKSQIVSFPGLDQVQRRHVKLLYS